MKHGNLVVMQMRPYEEYFAGLYSVAKEPWYGVFVMEKYHNNIGVEDMVEKSYKVDLKPVRISKELFPARAWYTDIFSNSNHKEFNVVTEGFKADGFCQIQNKRLKMLRDIKANPDKHIYFKDTKGFVHQFFYDKDKKKFYEKENGTLVADEDGMVYATEWEFEKILFDIDWEYSEPMKVKYNSFFAYIKHLFD